MLTNTAILGPFDKHRAALKTRQKRRDFFHGVCGIAQNLTLMCCLYTYVPEKCLLMLFLLNVPK